MRKFVILFLSAVTLLASCTFDYTPPSGGDSPGGGAPEKVPTVYGLYRSDGQSGTYLPGRDQLGLLRSEGKVWFRIISPSTVSMIEFGGIPETAAKGDEFTLTVRLSEGGTLASETTPRVTVVEVEGVRLALKDGDGTYYIVRR